MKWVSKNRKDLHNMIFLVDYELFDEGRNGLMLLSHVSVNSRGYLVSSHVEEIAIQNHASELNIWMIPKALLCDVVINFNNFEKVEA